MDKSAIDEADAVTLLSCDIDDLCSPIMTIQGPDNAGLSTPRSFLPTGTRGRTSRTWAHHDVAFAPPLPCRMPGQERQVVGDRLDAAEGTAICSLALTTSSLPATFAGTIARILK
jgi:hypothetical protein